MKRLHVHVAVADLATSVRFYSALFGAAPTVLQDDYAKWMLDDPRVNFALSARGQAVGVDHLGIQVEDDAELAELANRLQQAGQPMSARSETICCYARSDKTWTADPQGLPWETFYTLGAAPVYGEDRRREAPGEMTACCAPAIPARAACCEPSVGACCRDARS